ncbi:MAG: hypothetical protein K9W44_16330 [Candidatus Lokiarchaeota archaeon]|nr:hypothetical protein [Candidatus Harpocratesius repetitus]
MSLQTVIIPKIRKELQFYVKAVNKSTPPIKITSYGLKIVNSDFEIVIIPNSIQNI